PVVVLNAAAGNALLTDGAVLGSVLDVNLDSWTLEIKKLGEELFEPLASGDQPVNNGRLATLDVADMPNGFYVLRLTARDIGRRIARTEAVVEVRTATKRAYERVETDLTATLGGMTVTVARAYDSTRRGEDGKFGLGWRLLGRELDI